MPDPAENDPDRPNDAVCEPEHPRPEPTTDVNTPSEEPEEGQPGQPEVGGG